jgi:hypothetical protein
MMYALVYWTNLVLAAVMLLGAYWMANNEVDEERKKRMAFLSCCCVIEVAILVFYVPIWHPAYTDEMMTTLLFAKFVLKPGLISVLVYDVCDMRAKIERSKRHGQVSALVTPQTQEQVKTNQVAAALGKIDQAVDVAHVLEDEVAARKLSDSHHGLTRPGGAREETA